MPAQDFETNRSFVLKRGQVGTIVMIYDEQNCEVDFADAQGRTRALLPVPTEKLMRLHHMAEVAA
ncbi:hypothetical protein Thi970DRAFT_02172 [Thiorhodovibrio frisius]|uniref:DUF4926 domain-containing protein n=2 Tax=Chromatiaceae TaxID=1046 RepID=H8YZ09_9GAMM|nr:hypothetical protein Thi970DRAFT_02172 [Thiorhodovibrio frisius]WPL24225.1 hypothetical protein Thiofri_04441 [Thiorhodovibrio frisius]